MPDAVDRAAPAGAPALVAASHGTRDPAGRSALHEFRARISAARPDLEVLEAYADADVQQPGLGDVLAGLDRAGRAVVVPVLLSSGYHVSVDVAGPVAAAGSCVRAARPLGPDPALAGVLRDRLAAAGTEGHAIVLAAAGSSDERAARDVEQVAEMLAGLVGRPVAAAYATASEPSLDRVVAQLRAAGQRVAVAAYLLAPGHFHDRLRAAGADVVTDPMLPHPVLVDLVLRRYEEALTAA